MFVRPRTPGVRAVWRAEPQGPSAQRSWHAPREIPSTMDHDTHERPMLLGAYVCEAKARSRARLGPKSCVQVIVPIFGGRAHTAVSL